MILTQCLIYRKDLQIKITRKIKAIIALQLTALMKRRII